jgi:D-glycero-D-manno-heptose 1,7-bisphosphate phosphatase
MLVAAAEKYNIDLSASWMIGDDMRDVNAGKAAGCKTALIMAAQTKADSIADVYCTSLKEFTDTLALK